MSLLETDPLEHNNIIDGLAKKFHAQSRVPFQSQLRTGFPQWELWDSGLILNGKFSTQALHELRPWAVVQIDSLVLSFTLSVKLTANSHRKQNP